MKKIEKILIADDEAKIRQIYRELLMTEGYEVLEAENGDIADLLLENEGINLVLLDINMPVVNGPGLYDLLRLYDPRIKVIVTSVYPLDDQKKLICKADDYFDKSQSVGLLLSRVNHLLNTP